MLFEKKNDDAISIQKCKVLIIKYVNVEEINKDQIAVEMVADVHAA